MIVDGWSVPDGETVAVDVCIIGSGPAGSAIAGSLKESDLRVCVLESGGEVPDAESGDLSAGTSVGHPYFELQESRSRAIGGSSHLWEEYIRVRPLDPIDLERRHGLPWSGWPIEESELNRYYAAAHDFLHVGDDRYGPESWGSDDSAPLPLDGSLVASMVFRYTNTHDLTARGRGLEQSANVMLMTRTTATELVEAGDSIVEARAACLSGTRFSVRARAYVLAAGGIENPRLMLASRSSSPAGVGNHGDLVGRFFMEHLHVRSAIFHPSPAAADLSFYRQRDVGGTSVRGALVPRADVLRKEGLLNSSFLLIPSDSVRASDAYRSFSTVERRVRGRGLGVDSAPASAHVRALASHPVHAGRMAIMAGTGRAGSGVYQLAATAEQAPRPESRITLDTKRDGLGVPRPVLDWRVGDLERKSIRRAEELIDAELRAAGLGHLERLLGDERPRRIFRGHWHHIGTTRMDDDPRRGVVDRHGRVHGIDNLFVAGSSVFPTGGYANPTLTIVALALRLADRLGSSLGAGMGPLW